MNELSLYESIALILNDRFIYKKITRLQLIFYINVYLLVFIYLSNRCCGIFFVTYLKALFCYEFHIVH